MACQDTNIERFARTGQRASQASHLMITALQLCSFYFVKVASSEVGCPMVTTNIYIYIDIDAVE